MYRSLLPPACGSVACVYLASLVGMSHAFRVEVPGSISDLTIIWNLFLCILLLRKDAEEVGHDFCGMLI